MYLIKTREVYHFNNKRIWSRSSNVPLTFRRFSIIVYAGKRWYSRSVNRWMIGFKSGEFCWNRRLAIYKAKQMRKKKKKLLKNKTKINNSAKVKSLKVQKKAK